MAASIGHFSAMACTWRHVDILNNSEEVFREFGSIITQNASDNLFAFCTPTWPSNHVGARKQYILEDVLEVICYWMSAGNLRRIKERHALISISGDWMRNFTFSLRTSPLPSLPSELHFVASGISVKRLWCLGNSDILLRSTFQFIWRLGRVRLTLFRNKNT